MSEILNLELYEPTANEPQMRPLLKDSFVFVPTVGARLAPEVLVLELMREVFFERHYGDTTCTSDLDPSRLDDMQRPVYSKSQQAVLHALRGRRKLNSERIVQQYYAPAYPQLAELAWLRKNSERVINSLLFGGAISQHLWSGGGDSQAKRDEQKTIVGKIVTALIGSHSHSDDGYRRCDILAATLMLEHDPELATRAEQIMLRKTGETRQVIRVERDQMAERITSDFLSICDLERRLGRMQWIQLLMTFLRLALPLWLLAHMRITELLHEWLVDAMENGTIATQKTIVQRLSTRNRELLHPTITPTRELLERIERYMRCRVEVNIMLRWIEIMEADGVRNKTLNVEPVSGSTLSISDLLPLARNARERMSCDHRFADDVSGLSTRTLLTRVGERFAAWRNPLKSGQGKNIDEFFRVLYRASIGDEYGGYLLIPEGRGSSRGFAVLPGQLLLTTIAYLAAACPSSMSPVTRHGSGKLMLRNIEDHFAQYGVQFASTLDARPYLVDSLRAMGLLAGSPDAGSSVAVTSPFRLRD